MFFKLVLISIISMDLCFCDDKSSGDADVSHPSDTITGIWNVVAEDLPDNISLHARCWTVEIFNISSTIYNGTTTYFDENTNKTVDIPFKAHGVRDGSFFSVLVMFDITIPLFKVSNASVSSNMAVWSFFYCDDSTLLGRLFVSRNLILSTEEKQLLEGQSVKNYLNNNGCSLQPTSTTEVPKAIDVPTSSITLNETTYVKPATDTATETTTVDSVMSISSSSINGTTDLITGTWTVFAKSSFDIAIPKVRCWIIEIEEISPTLYNSTTTYIDDERKLKNIISTEAHNTGDGFFIGVLLMPDNSVSYAKVPGTIVERSLVSWKVSDSNNSNNLGRLFVSRNSVLSTEEKQHLARQSITDHINSTNCPLHAQPMRAHTPSVHQSANPTFLCIIATYVFTFAHLFGLW